MPELLRDCGVHTHLVTDHYHYFEDGGATYHIRYRSYEAFRVQEGDAWKGVVGDQNDMWKDTMLIVCTDHGFMLGEHDHWAKCYFPFYNEIANTPLFIWDLRIGKKKERRRSLVQTIDLSATLLEFFGVPLPADMQGVPLKGRRILGRSSPCMIRSRRRGCAA